ncbi:phosphotransferase, partial [Zoogloea sp.]|uniref:phosphotransferase n=1 Tax=Zoogloea sp. TaxID=49181 RepID=UPI001AC1C092
RAACREVLGQDAETVTPMRCAGDHFAYRVRCAGQELLFRAAADATGDDYMLAEDAAMAAARAVGVPVPHVLRTVAEPCAGLRWQLMELVPGSTLRDLAIDRAAIAADLGRILRRLHTVGAEGYGFLDTAHLRSGAGMRGLDASYG